MSKKIIILIIILVGGVALWQLSLQNKRAMNKVDKTAANLVEVFYLPHPPVDPIREKIKNILQKFPEYKLVEYDFDDKNSEDKINQYKLFDHIPVAIFINGKDTFLVDGKKITFRNFPQSDPFVPTYSGLWDYSDLEKILANQND